MPQIWEKSRSNFERRPLFFFWSSPQARRVNLAVRLRSTLIRFGFVIWPRIQWSCFAVVGKEQFISTTSAIAKIALRLNFFVLKHSVA